jgi:hypothetical protein
MIVSRERLGEILGISNRRLDELVREGLPGEAPKVAGDRWKFDTAPAVGWLREKERKLALGEVAKVDANEAKRRKIAAEAALMELELAKAQGLLLPISDFVKAWEQMIGSCRAKMLALGSKLGPALAIISDAAECNLVIDRSVNEALLELSDFEPNIPFDCAGESEHSIQLARTEKRKDKQK